MFVIIIGFIDNIVGSFERGFMFLLFVVFILICYYFRFKFRVSCFFYGEFFLFIEVIGFVGTFFF